MNNSIFEHIEPAHKLVADGFVLGGDFAEHAVGAYNVACYAAVAMHKTMIVPLEACINAVISKHLGVLGSSVEVHAAEIWNGSTRKLGPYRVLDHKDRMKLFFAELCAIVGMTRPFIVVAAKCLGQQLADSGNKGMLKKLLIYAAFSRIDNNVRILYGKHIGQPTFFHDRENESLVTARPGDPENQFGGLIDVHVVPGTDPAAFRLFKAFDPVYTPTDSKEHRLIQIADVAAYFVGKFLRLRAEVLMSKNFSDVSRRNKILDANFCRTMWDAFNLEAALVVFENERRKHPLWISNVVDPYQRLFEAGIDMCICSIREAVNSDGSVPGGVAIGFLE